jgi:LPXTG-site transpeptidase (sortase) family protein
VGTTWLIPPFKVGHAENTVGAGEIGNALLYGHVTSLRVGHVFQHLSDVRVGDPIEVAGSTGKYTYTVVEKREVDRTDTSILGPTPTASVSLITCAGVWLPLEGDYTRRLLVRAELAPSLAQSSN